MSFSGNLILLDSRYEEIQPELNDCLINNTAIILFDSNVDDYETIKNRINDYKDTNNVIISGIAVFKDNDLTEDGKFKYLCITGSIACTWTPVV